MDSVLLSKLQKFKLRDEEESGVRFSRSDVQSSTEECSRCLIGKIYGEKVANFARLKNTLSLLSSFIGPMKIRELGTNFYQFVFESQRVKDRIQQGKAWTFDSQFLILKLWSEELNFQKEAFNRVHIWIQVWNLPNH